MLLIYFNKSRLSNILNNCPILLFLMKTKLTLLITEIKTSIARGENFGRSKFRAAKFSRGKISAQLNFYSAKLPAAKLPAWKFPVAKLSRTNLSVFIELSIFLDGD